jgi:prophage regulatory protein
MTPSIMSIAYHQPTLLRLPAVKRETGLSASHIRALSRAGKFPRPIKIGARAIAWRASDLQAWIEARAADRDAPSDAQPKKRHRGATKAVRK